MGILEYAQKSSFDWVPLCLSLRVDDLNIGLEASDS